MPRPGMSEEFCVKVKISNLFRRNLIAKGTSNYRIHRSLQLGLLLKLDVEPDKR
jgi:hypothetical protein